MSAMESEMIEAIDDGEGYNWWVFGVRKFEDGTLAYGRDGGCSCNYPWDGDFKDARSFAAMYDGGVLTAAAWDQFADALDDWASGDDAKAEAVQVKKRISALIGW